MKSKQAALCGVLLAAASIGVSAGELLHPFALPQPANAPEEVLLAVEIPAGGVIKYELGEHGELRVDRFLSMPVAYPANYGSMPQTLAGDGDPLDALVLTRFPIQPGAIVRFRPLGVLRMVDKGEADEKIVGVPVDAVDPTYAKVQTLQDLPVMEVQRIEAFFRTYKQLPSGADIQLNGWGDAAEARQVVRKALQEYQRVKPTR
ncbi:inorganic diphosphatase [Stenotrophomonas pigmentata]|uniref:inorganic diphosphatase n=1 Tax=Stenotrophomonas pigmentata TaxID=3055080 RepID=UPI0026EC42F2|nr:inorganic diphosphatase [Stenotrophomonas sp. 610A2]